MSWGAKFLDLTYAGSKGTLNSKAMIELIMKPKRAGVSMYLLTQIHPGIQRLNYTWTLKTSRMKCGRKFSDWSLAVARLGIGFQMAPGQTLPLTLFDYLDYFVLK